MLQLERKIHLICDTLVKSRVVLLPNGGGAGGLLGTTGAQCDPHMGVKEEVLPRLLPHMRVGGGGEEAKPATVCVGKVLLNMMVMVMTITMMMVEMIEVILEQSRQEAPYTQAQ